VAAVAEAVLEREAPAPLRTRKRMRILVVGSSNQWRMESGVERALQRQGHNTALIDDRRAKQRLGLALAQKYARWKVRRFRPEFVILGKCLGLTLDTVHDILRGLPSAMWYMDAPWYQFIDRPDVAHIKSIGHLAGTFFVNGFEHQWRALGLNAKYLPAAADRDIRPVPPDPRFATDIAFIGTRYDPARADLLLRLADREQVKVWGTGWEQWRDQLDWSGRPVEGHDFAKVCSSSKIVLGINPQMMRDATNSASNRMWITTLGGGFYLGPGTPGIVSLMRDGVHCAWYRDEQELFEKARYYLSHDRERVRVRETGEAFVRTHHTFDQRVVNLINDREFVNPL
jgi:hypothetical protein